jgi:hypothetical protein
MKRPAPALPSPAAPKLASVPAPTPAARGATTALAEALSTVIREAVFDAFAELMDAERAAQVPAPALISRAALADALGVCTATIAAHERQGLPRIMIGDSPRYRLADCIAWYQSRTAERSR